MKNNYLGAKFFLAILLYAALASAVPTQKWAHVSGNYGYGVVVDSSGFIYRTGMDLAGNLNPFISKHSPVNGDTIWSTAWSPFRDDYSIGLARDPSTGDLYTVGYSMSFGPGDYDLFIVKYNSTGDKQWNKTWSYATGSNDFGWDIAFDGANLYTTAFVNPGPAGGYDIYLIKWDTDGNQVWNRTWGGAGNDAARGIALDSSGNIYFTGYSSTGLGGTDAIILKYNSAGVLQWSRAWGGGDDDYGWDVNFDSSDNLYLVGTTKSGFVDFEGFITKYDSGLVSQWNRTWGYAGIDEAYYVTNDSSGGAYVAGYSNFGVGNPGAIVLKYDTNGNYLWNVTNLASANYATRLAANATGHIYIAGYRTSPAAVLIDYFDDYIAPTVGPVNPATTTQGVATNFNVTASENDGIKNCTFWWNGSLIGNMDLLSGTNTSGIWNYSYTPANAGSQYSWANCTDGVGNSDKTNTTINVNAPDSPPTVTLESPAPGSTWTSPTVPFNFTPVDDLGFSNCSLWTNGSGAWGFDLLNSSPVVNDSINTISRTFPDNETYVWNVECCDSGAHCEFATENRTVTINETVYIDNPPSVALDWPPDNEIVTSLTVPFNFTPLDDWGFDNCSLWTNASGGWAFDTLNQTAISNGSTNTMTKTFAENGAYLWNIECCDNASQCAFAPGDLTIIVNVPGAGPAERGMNVAAAPESLVGTLSIFGLAVIVLAALTTRKNR